MSRTLATAAIALSVTAGLAASAKAAISHFVNPEPGQPGHYAWQLDMLGPPSWLDVTLSAQEQTNTPSTSSVAQLAGSFGNLHHHIPGSPGLLALVLGHTGLIPFTAAISFGDPVQADDMWAFLASTAHIGGGDLTYFPEGELRYIGVLTMDGRHGWIEVVRQGMTLNAHSWAYQTEPGVAIYAGQIPAPGALWTLTIGVFARRRRSRS